MKSSTLLHVIIITTCLAVILSAVSVAAGQWTFETLGSAVWFDMAVEPDGTPHIVVTNCTHGEFCFGSPMPRYLIHRVKRSGVWMSDTIAVDPAGFSPSITLDGSGGVHVAYMDSLTDLKYIYGTPGGPWTTESLPHSNPNALRNEPDIALDDTGGVHISYNERERPWYQWRSNGGWTEEQVSSNFADNDIARTSLKVGSDGIPRIAYWSFANWAVIYERVGGVWTENIIGGEDKRSPSLALDSNNAAHVLYRGSGPIYATNKTGAWAETVLEPFGQQGDLVLTPAGTPIVAYPGTVLMFDTTFFSQVDLYVSVQVDSLWQRESVVSYTTTPSGGSNFAPRLAVDDVEMLHMTYRHPLTGEIVYGYRDVPGGSDKLPASGTAMSLSVSPNPFNAMAVIHYNLPFAGNLRLDVFDVRGRHVRRLIDRHHDGGPHQLPWDGHNTNGELVSSGVYFLQMTSAAGTVVNRAVFLK